MITKERKLKINFNHTKKTLQKILNKYLIFINSFQIKSLGKEFMVL